MRKYRLCCFLLILYSVFAYANRCQEIDMAFSSVESTDAKKPVCRCYKEGMGSSRKSRSFEEDGDDLWIGCTGYNMPAVFRSLDALNETFISRLVIWNSLINLVPSDMFSKVRPKSLALENCVVSLLRPNAFGRIGRRMKTLILRNNAFQRIEASIAKELPGLEKLDLSENKIPSIGNNSFVGLALLEELLLDNNHLTEIKDGDLWGLPNLKTLNLANNKITKINKNAFDGLDNLEVLILKGNNLADIDWTAFHGLKKLKVLDMGVNHLTNVDLRRLQNLQRLYLNNNSIQSLKSVALRDLTSLESLSLDRNFITEIDGDDLNYLSQSPSLSSLSLVSNKIAKIGNRAFEHLHALSILSLQNNEYSGKVSFLHPLKKLKSLYMSHNKIASIRSDAFQGLVHLKELSLDHNDIKNIENGAFKGILLNKLFLNNNQLHFLPDGLFDRWSKDEIYAVDLSENEWECVCAGGDGWLSEWLHSIGKANTPQGNLGCLLETCSKHDDVQHPQWMTAVAITFSICIIACIIIIGFLLVQEGKRLKLSTFVNNIYRAPSDRERLIVPDPMSFPNPITSKPENDQPTRTSIKLAGSSGNGSKKKVHFNDS